MAASNVTLAKEIENYYEILDIEKNEANDLETLKKARKAARSKVHPDKIGGSAAKFNLVDEAYTVLSNPTKKAEYDISWEKNKAVLLQNPRDLPDYGRYLFKAKVFNTGKEIDAEKIKREFKSANVNVQIYIPPGFQPDGEIKGFKVEKPLELELALLSFNEKCGTLHIYTTHRHDWQTSHADIDELFNNKTFLLTACENSIVVGLITVNAGNKFAIFSLIDGLQDSDIITVLKDKSFASRPLYELAAAPPPKEFYSITQNLIPASKYSRPLTEEEKKFALEKLKELTGKFNSEKKMLAIQTALGNNSVEEFHAALEIQRIPFSFWKKSLTSEENMPESLRKPLAIDNGNGNKANQLAIGYDPGK